MNGVDLEFTLPVGATVTGAVGIINYQYLQGDQVREGTVWAVSPMVRPQAVGMIRMAQIAVEEDGMR
ncbi:MAG: hypothetical protein ACTIAQ_04250 [Glutamicibacter arilaitensis]